MGSKAQKKERKKERRLHRLQDEEKKSEVAGGLTVCWFIGLLFRVQWSSEEEEEEETEEERDCSLYCVDLLSVYNTYCKKNVKYFNLFKLFIVILVV